MPFADTLATNFGFGMTESMLAPYLESIGAPVVQVGVVFLLMAGASVVGIFCAGMVSYYNGGKRNYLLICKYYLN